MFHQKSQEVMLAFLRTICQIKRIKVHKKNRFQRSIIIDGAFLLGLRSVYPLNTKDKEVIGRMKKDLYMALKNMFCFHHEEMTECVETFMKTR